MQSVVSQYLQTWRHNPHLSESLWTMRAKRTYVSEDSGLLRYDSVPLGEWPTFRKYVGNRWPNDMVSTKNTCSENHKSHISLHCYKTYRGAVTSSMWRQCYNSVLEQAIRQTYNVKLPTGLLFTEFNTTITLVLLTNGTDLASAGVSHKCGHKTSRRIVNVGVICMIMLLYSYNEHLHTTPSTDRLKITSASIIGPSGSTRVSAAPLLWVWSRTQTGERTAHKTLSLRNVL